MREIWKTIAGWEGLYEVSNLGRVKRIAAGRGTRSGKIQKTSPGNQAGHMVATLRKNGRSSKEYVHQLVAMAFIGKPKNPKLVVNHENGNTADNRVGNLKYVTRSQNALHCFRVLKRPTAKGESQSNAVLSESDVREIRSHRSSYGLQPMLAEKYGVSISTIASVRLRKTWRHVA